MVTGEQQRVSIRDLNITVSLGDRRDVAAALIGVDPATDLALLKIDATNLPTIPWGDSSKLRIAEWVLAIGNPYQLNSTVTLGIVSAVNRTNLGISAYEDFVQTDAAINPGNSGGALVNARGELVGINTVIFSAERRLPGDRVRGVEPTSRGGCSTTCGSTARFAAGRSATSRCCRSRRSWRRNSPRPIRRGWRLPASAAPPWRPTAPAFASATWSGRFNGTAITDAGQLYRLISDAPVGSTATLGVLREGTSGHAEGPDREARRAGSS